MGVNVEDMSRMCMGLGENTDNFIVNVHKNVSDYGMCGLTRYII